MTETQPTTYERHKSESVVPTEQHRVRTPIDHILERLCAIADGAYTISPFPITQASRKSPGRESTTCSSVSASLKECGWNKTQGTLEGIVLTEGSARDILEQ
jgi:hypothetical protein